MRIEFVEVETELRRESRLGTLSYEYEYIGVDRSGVGLILALIPIIRRRKVSTRAQRSVTLSGAYAITLGGVLMTRLRFVY